MTRQFRPEHVLRPFATLAVVAAVLALCPGGRARAAGADTAPPAAPAVAPRAARPPLKDLDHLLGDADSMVRANGGMASPHARLYLAWNEPYGLPGAARSRYPRSRDPRSADTLYLSFLPGRPAYGFLSFTAYLDFRATGGDTLGPWWQMERGGMNSGGMRVEYGPDPSFPQAQPWAVRGVVGYQTYTRTPRVAHLEMLLAVPYDDAIPLPADSVYTLCRIILDHRKALPGCAQPVCVEWSQGELDYWLRDTPTVSAGERFVAYAGPVALCDAFAVADSASASPPHGGPAAPVRAKPAKQRPKPRAAPSPGR